MREEAKFKQISGEIWTGKRAGVGHVGGHIGASCAAALVIAVMLCGTGLAYGQNQKNQKNKDKNSDTSGTASSLMSDNQAVDLAVSQMLGAWQAGDAEALRKFYADDVIVVSAGWEPPLIGWNTYAFAYQAQLARTSGSRLERTNSYIKVTGDTAWVTYQFQYVGTVDGKTAQAFGHTTLVLQKRAGTWLIVLNHTSAIPTDQPISQTTSAPANANATSSLSPGGK